MKLGMFTRQLVAVAALTAGMAHAAPSVLQVWNNASLSSGSTSAVFTVPNNETITVYFKTNSLPSSDYDVYIETSPDGVNWWSYTDSFTVYRSSPVGWVTRKTITAKAIKVRLRTLPVSGTTSFSGTGTGWIVN